MATKPPEPFPSRTGMARSIPGKSRDNHRVRTRARLHNVEDYRGRTKVLAYLDALAYPGVGENVVRFELNVTRAQHLCVHNMEKKNKKKQKKNRQLD